MASVLEESINSTSWDTKVMVESPMWVTRFAFMAEKRLGYWESGIYSDTADPWKDDRYRK